MKRILTEITSASGAKVYALITGIITLSLTGRLLGPDGRGGVAAITTWVSVFALFGSLSLGQIVLHRASGSQGAPLRAAMLANLLCITCAVSLIGWAAVAVMYLSTHGHAFKNLHPTLLAISFLSLPFIVWEQYGSALLTSIDRINVYNRAQIIGRTVGFILVLVLVWRLRLGVIGALCALLLAQMTVSLTGIRSLFQQITERVWPDVAGIKELIRSGLQVHLSAIGGVLLTSMDVLILSQYRGLSETGHYQLAVQLINVFLMAPQAASMVIYSKMSQLGVDGVWDIQRRVILYVTLAMIAAAAAAAALAPWFIPLLVGRAFLPSVGVFRLLLIAVVSMTFSSLMIPQWIGRGMFWQASILSISVCLINGVANIILVPRYGMYGSAWATVCTYMIVVAVNLRMALWISHQVRTQTGSVTLEPAGHGEKADLE